MERRMSLGPEQHSDQDFLVNEYTRIYGFSPPAGVDVEQLRFAVTDGSGYLKEPASTESVRARIYRERWEGSIKNSRQERSA